MKQRRGTALGTSSLVGLLALYWALSSLALWLAYDMRAQILGGRYGQGQALGLVAKMALIITALTGVIWLLIDWRKANRRRWRLAWNVVWKTCGILIAYVGVVLVRRQLWTPSQGMNDNAAFLPIVGYINGRFLGEFEWLSFVTEVIPIVGLMSGALYVLRDRMLRTWNSMSMVRSPI
jgi:hypothetical protein